MRGLLELGEHTSCDLDDGNVNFIVGDKESLALGYELIVQRLSVDMIQTSDTSRWPLCGCSGHVLAYAAVLFSTQCSRTAPARFQFLMGDMYFQDHGQC